MVVMLDVAAAEAVAAKAYARRRAGSEGVRIGVGERPSRPVRHRLVQPRVAARAALDLVDAAVAEHLRSVPRVLFGVPVLKLDVRGVAARAAPCVVVLLVELRADRQSQARGKLHVRFGPTGVLGARVGVVDVERRVRAVERESAARARTRSCRRSASGPTIGPPKVALICWFEYGSTLSWMKSFAFSRRCGSSRQNDPESVLVPDLVMAFTIMPIDRPCVASNRFVIELELGDRVAAVSRLVVAQPDEVGVTCWPSMLIWNSPGASSGALADCVLPAARCEQRQVHPVAAVDRQSCIWRGSMLPLRFEDAVSISGASPVTVTVSASVAGAIWMLTESC